MYLQNKYVHQKVSQKKDHTYCNEYLLYLNICVRDDVQSILFEGKQ